MRWKQELIFIIRRLIHRRSAERELDEEIRAHLAMEVEQNVADGMSPEDARLAANRNGNLYKNTYTGMIEPPIKMSGACEFPKGSGKWTATKK